MSNLDATIGIELEIIDLHSEFTLVQVDIPYLNKTIEVKVPNNVQEGHKIRLKDLGYSDDSGNRGDLYLIISKIKSNNDSEEISMQKMMVVEYNDFCDVNYHLENGWRVKDFKPLRDGNIIYVYVLLEK